MRVSKKWTQFIERYKTLWMRLDLADARRQVSKSAILKYISRSDANLTHAVLNNIVAHDVTKVLEWLSRCNNLVHLEIAAPCDGEDIYRLFGNLKELKTLVTSPEVPVKRSWISKFMKKLPNLETIEIHRSVENTEYVEPLGKFPKLKKAVYGMHRVSSHIGEASLLLPFIGSFGVPDPLGGASMEQTIAEIAPNLEELGLHSHVHNPRSGFSLHLETICLPQLRKVDLSYFMLRGDWTFSRTLEHLEIRSCKRVSTSEMEYLPRRLSNLKTLILDNLDWLDWRHLASLLSDIDSTLEVFDLKNCFKILPIMLSHHARESKAFKSVHTLILEGMYYLDDRFTGELIEQLPNLKVLSIPNTCVTGVLVKNIVAMRGDEGKEPQDPAGDKESDKKPRIEVLNLKGCAEVSMDAIDYGRQKALRIMT
jgi:F-box/TPR repeat protein Pof3